MSVRKLSTASILSPSYKNSKIWDGTTFPGYFESIATVIAPSAGLSTITFNNIPQNYAHLQLRMMVFNSAYGNLRFNNDTTASNYYSHQLVGGGGGSDVIGAAYANNAYSPYSTASNQPYVEILDILDYTNTNKFKTTRALSGVDMNGSGSVRLASNLWRSATAINRIDLTANTGNFAQNSHFALYGIRGA